MTRITFQRKPRLSPPLSTWSPSPEQLHLASKLGKKDLRAATLAWIKALPEAERVDIWRAGLRLEDQEAAIVCASKLELQWCDSWEVERAVTLLRPIFTRPGNPVNFFHFDDFMGASHQLDFFQHYPAPPYGISLEKVHGDFHRKLRSDQIPAMIEVMLHGPSPAARRETMESLGFHTLYSNRNADRIRRAFLEYEYRYGSRREDVAALPPPGNKEGIDPHLIRSLTYWVLQQPVEKDIGELFSIDHIALARTQAAPCDVPFLLALANSNYRDAPELAARLMGRLHDMATERWLRELPVHHKWESLEAIALASLARRGNKEDRARLVSKSLPDHLPGPGQGRESS